MFIFIPILIPILTFIFIQFLCQSYFYVFIPLSFILFVCYFDFNIFHFYFNVTFISISILILITILLLFILILVVLLLFNTIHFTCPTNPNRILLSLQIHWYFISTSIPISCMLIPISFLSLFYLHYILMPLLFYLYFLCHFYYYFDFTFDFVILIFTSTHILM